MSEAGLQSPPSAECERTETETTVIPTESQPNTANHNSLEQVNILNCIKTLHEYLTCKYFKYYFSTYMSMGSVSNTLFKDFRQGYAVLEDPEDKCIKWANDTIGSR